MTPSQHTPVPKYKHGEQLLGGTVVFRTNINNQAWKYTIIMPPGSPNIIVYHIE